MVLFIVKISGMRICCICIFLLKCWAVFSQAVLPHQGISKRAKEGYFCRPGLPNSSRSRGLEVSYNFFNGGPLTYSDESSLGPDQLTSLQYLGVKAKIPVLLKPSFKVLVGFDYEMENVNFSSPALRTKASEIMSDIDTRSLTTTGLKLYALKSFDRSRYLGFRGAVKYRGDYTGVLPFEDRYAAYSLSLLYGVKKTQDKEWGVGLSYSKNFRRWLILPFFLYNRNFNNQWGVEAVFPAQVNGRYNLNPETILLFGYEFNSSNYSLDLGSSINNNYDIYHHRRAEVLFGFTVERHLASWLWVESRAGFQYNFNTHLEATFPNGETVSFKPADGLYFRMGLFLSPPN